MNEPFFIVGCVRSGTTLLRNVLRRHPRLECPEETHFYRWGDPFGTEAYRNIYLNNPTLVKHREIDGIEPEEFDLILKEARSRRELNDRYCELFLRKRGNPGGRWFDKTPQNIFGLAMLSRQYPESKFVHIVRHPLNVVASLKIGKVIKVDDLIGASNYWMESLAIIDAFKQGWPDRLLEIRYETLLGNGPSEIQRLLNFLGEDPSALDLPDGLLKPEKNKYRDVLSREEIDFVQELCGPRMRDYDYDHL